MRIEGSSVQVELNKKTPLGGNLLTHLLHDEPFIRTKAATSVDVLGGGCYRILRLLLVVQ